MKKLLEEKENSIQLLKKKINIHTTQLLEGSELAKMEKEKEDLKNELLDYKEKLLKFADKEKQWQKDMALVVESEKTLKGKHGEMEKKLQERERELEGKDMTHVAQTGEHSIVQAMSQEI